MPTPMSTAFDFPGFEDGPADCVAVAVLAAEDVVEAGIDKDVAVAELEAVAA